jgi:hypothetical protein
MQIESSGDLMTLRLSSAGRPQNAHIAGELFPKRDII